MVAVQTLSGGGGRGVCVCVCVCVRERERERVEWSRVAQSECCVVIHSVYTILYDYQQTHVKTTNAVSTDVFNVCTEPD